MVALPTIFTLSGRSGTGALAADSTTSSSRTLTVSAGAGTAAQIFADDRRITAVIMDDFISVYVFFFDTLIYNYG